MEKDLVSIIIPVYNVEQYLNKSLTSVIEQTYKKLQIIIVNDGSTDNGEIEIKKIMQRDNRITYIKQENMGLSMARNNGMRYAKGEYIYFFDSDDILELNAIEKMYTAIKKTGADMAICNYKTINGRGKIVDSIEHTTQEIEVIQKEDIKKRITNDYINHRYENHVWDKLYKMQIIIDNQLLFEDKLIEDILFNMKIHPFLNKIVYIKDYGYFYGLRDTSIMGKYNKDFFDVYSNLFYSLENYYKKLDVLNDYGGFLSYNVYVILGLAARNCFEHARNREFLRDIEKCIKNEKIMKYNKELRKNNKEITGKKKVFIKLFSFFLQYRFKYIIYIMFFIKYKLKV